MDQKRAQSVSACHKCRLHKAGWKGRGVGVGQERVGEKGALNFHSTIFHTITPNLAAVHWDEATEQAKLCFAKKHFVYLHLFSSIRYWPRLDKVSHFLPQSPGAKLVWRRRPLSGQLAPESPAGSWHAVAHRCHIHGSSAPCGPVCLWWCKKKVNASDATSLFFLNSQIIYEVNQPWCITHREFHHYHN